MDEYRKWLIAAEQKSQADFDKTILSLSGGALGVSFVFLKDVIGPQPIVLYGYLLAAWIAWALSTLSVLCSFHLSHLALRKAITQVDDGTIHTQQPGGAFAAWTAQLNRAGAILFFAGVCFITVFAGANLSSKGVTNDKKESPVAITAPNTTQATIPAANTDTGQPRTINRGVHPSTSTTDKTSE